jgi:hypothetical protein
MAMAVDATGSSGDDYTSPITWTHVVGSGENMLLVVGVMVYSYEVQPTCSGVTYNGVAMTKVRGDQKSTTYFKVESSLWVLKAPASGSHTVSATISNYDPLNGTSGCGASISFSGAAQVNAADASNGTTGTSTGAKTVNVTTVADNCYVVAAGIYGTDESDGTITVGSGSTHIAGVLLYGGSFGDTEFQRSTGVKTPAGTFAANMTLATSSGGYAITAASFAPYVSANAILPQVIMV